MDKFGQIYGIEEYGSNNAVMINDHKNNVRCNWLTNRKALWIFMTSSFNKCDFFNK